MLILWAHISCQGVNSCFLNATLSGVFGLRKNLCSSAPRVHYFGPFRDLLPNNSFCTGRYKDYEPSSRPSMFPHCVDVGEITKIMAA